MNVTTTAGPGSSDSENMSGDPLGRTDLGNAVRLCRYFGDHIHFCPKYGGWLCWDGQRWASDETGQVMRYAKDSVVTMLNEAKALPDDDRRALIKWQVQSEAEARLRAMLSLAETEPGIPVRTSELDANPWLLNVENGTLNLELGSLGSHWQRDLITKLAPVRYLGDGATCPRWLDFLGEIFDGDTELIRFVQKAVGYSMTGSTREQCLFILYGTGANGKSTFLEVLRSMLGDYAMQSDFGAFLLNRGNDGPRNDVARLAGARFVSAIEVEQGRRLAESLVKSLTGQDVITARFLYRESFEFRPAFKVWMAVNHKPVIRGTDNAIWRRIRTVPFTVAIPPERQDRSLVTKLRAESPGILHWALEGCAAWRAEGLEPPEPVRAATREYRDEMDVLAGFLSDCCVLASNARASAAKLYDAYKRWCEANGERAESQRRFGGWLVDRDFRKSRSGRNGATEYLGLALNLLNNTEPFSGSSPREGDIGEVPEKGSDPSDPSVGQENRGIWD